MYADTPYTPSEGLARCVSSPIIIKGNEEKPLVFSSGSLIHVLGSELILGSDDGSGIEMLIIGGIKRDRDVVG